MSSYWCVILSSYFGCPSISLGTHLSSYRLVYWEEKKWDYPSGFYMGLYAGAYAQ